MKRTITRTMTFHCLALILGMLLAAPSALAMEFGLMSGGGYGDGDADYSGYPRAAGFDLRTQDIGFAINACEYCGWLNYRLNVAFTKGSVDYGQFEDDAKGLSITNTLGVKLVNRKAFRMWLGASLHTAGLILDGDRSNDDDASVWGYGPTVGMDFRTPEGVTISLELAGRFLQADINNDWHSDYDINDAALRLSFLF